MKKQSLIKASIVLVVAGMVAKFLGVFFRWPLIMLIGDEGIGYYQMTYPLYMFFVAIASGIPIVVSKMISEKSAIGDVDGVFEVVKESTILMLFLGCGTTFILFFFAKPIINFLRWDMKSYYSLLGISFAPLIISIMTVYRGFFQGLQQMLPVGISQVIEQVGRVLVGVGLAYLLFPMGIEYAAGGAAFGAAAGGIVGAIYLYFKYRKVRKGYNVKKVRTNTRLLTKVLKTAIPVSFGATVGSVMTLIDSIMVPKKLLLAGMTPEQATILYGQLTGKAGVLINIPLTLSVALCTSLIPIIAENYILKRKKELNKNIYESMKLSLVIGLPCMVGLFLLASPIMKLIFPGRFEGVEILQYLSISIPFIILNQTATSIFQGTGYAMKAVFSLFVGCIVKVILTWILVPMPEINIFGAIIATISAYVVSTILNIILMKITLKVKINLIRMSIKPIISSVFMAVTVLFSYTYIWNKTSSNLYSCLISIFLGIIVYGILVLILRIYEIDDFKSRLGEKF